MHTSPVIGYILNMPIYTEPDEPAFIAAEARDNWFVAVMLADYGELESAPDDTDVPDDLNWLLQVPPDRRNDFDEVECSLAYVSTDGAYRCTLWDATGEEDDPWAVFLVDAFGPRLLPEYSVFDEDADEETREEALRRAAEELTDRLEGGQFTRTGEAAVIPEWLRVPEEML
jgi:hypothetical protein